MIASGEIVRFPYSPVNATFGQWPNGGSAEQPETLLPTPSAVLQRSYRARQYIPVHSNGGNLSLTESTANDEAMLRAVVLRLLNGGARVTEDARWLVGILPADLLGFLRSEVCAAIRQKASDPTKARKIFLSLGKTGRVLFGAEYAATKQTLDAESRAVAREKQR